MTTRRQHYVWRHYLEMWKGPDNLVSCLRNKKLFQTSSLNVMVERDFYKLQPLSRSELTIVHHLLVAPSTSTYVRQLHDTHIAQFTNIAIINDKLQRHPTASAQDKDLMRDLVLEAEERLHSGVEKEALPVLNALRSRDSNILEVEETAFAFINFVSQQYFRTKKMRELIYEGCREFVPTDSARRMRNLLCYCYAVNVGSSLYVDRKELEITYLDCLSNLEFITGDQPLVNLFGTRDNTPTEELVLYYPLSPKLAMVLAPKEMDLGASLSLLGESEVWELNDLIAWEAREILVAKTSNMLARYERPRTSPPALMRVLTQHG